jgi:hypothetical protein
MVRTCAPMMSAEAITTVSAPRCRAVWLVATMGVAGRVDDLAITVDEASILQELSPS